MIEFRNISKSYGSAAVLRGVSCSLPPGKTLGLVGENGAGKSTLMNVLGGNVRPDSGRMFLAGRPFSPRNPLEATQAGIAFIHQELNLFPNLSIAENLFLANFPTVGSALIRRGQVRQRASELLGQVGLKLDPDCLVEKLSAGERQLLEIAKALSTDTRLIIFDEPTTSLTAPETEVLFGLIERLRARGISLIYISHTLADVLHLSDEILVLRDGEAVAGGPKSEFDIARLISLMVGRCLNQLFPIRKGRADGEPLLEVQHVSQPGIVHGINFRLSRGEVLGISGLMGSGRSELARILFGLDPCAQGEIRLAGRPLPAGDVRARIRAGLAFLTENRREEGLSLDASISDNIMLASLRQHASGPFRFLDSTRLAQAAKAMSQAVRLTAAAGEDTSVRHLSGGNQQKVVLAKWLLSRPRVLLLDEPTRGIDVGAKFEIYQLVLDLADGGTGVLVISSELEELLGICDRVLVMSRGEIRDEITRDQFDRERIMRAALRSDA